MKASTPTRTPAQTPTPSVHEGEVAIIVEEGEGKVAEALDVSECIA